MSRLDFRRREKIVLPTHRPPVLFFFQSLHSDTCDGMGRYRTRFSTSAAFLLLQNKEGEGKTICKSCGVRTDCRCKNRYGCLGEKVKKKKRNDRVEYKQPV